MIKIILLPKKSDNNNARLLDTMPENICQGLSTIPNKSWASLRGSLNTVQTKSEQRRKIINVV